MTRRQFGAALGSLAALPFSPLSGRKTDTRVDGVLIGVQSYSLRDRPLEAAIEGMVQAGLDSCELWSGHVEPSELTKGRPASSAREELRRWRLTTPLEFFESVRRKFDQARVGLSAYNLSFRDDFSDSEIERGFEMARALGVKVITASLNLSTVSRVDAAARRYGIRVGVHNHSSIRPNEVATPDDFATALKDGSEMMAINLDIGHFTAANYDAVAFLRQHHARIVTMHIKDRKRDQGPNVPFGTGDTPIGPVLRLLRDERWPIAANLEYEYQGADTIEELKRCLAYCRGILRSNKA